MDFLYTVGFCVTYYLENRLAPIFRLMDVAWQKRGLRVSFPVLVWKGARINGVRSVL